MSGKKRLAIFVSGLWIVVVAVLSLLDERLDRFLFGTLVLGILPVGFVWGLAWVLAGFSEKIRKRVWQGVAILLAGGIAAVPIYYFFERPGPEVIQFTAEDIDTPISIQAWLVTPSQTPSPGDRKITDGIISEWDGGAWKELHRVPTKHLYHLTIDNDNREAHIGASVPLTNEAIERIMAQLLEWFKPGQQFVESDFISKHLNGSEGLPADSREELRGILGRMVVAAEPPENLQLVVKDFSERYLEK
jgi:hypothetical protein